MQFTYDTDMFVKTFESEFTWLNGFMRNVRRFGNRTAVIDPARNIKWTYTELIPYTHRSLPTKRK